MRYIALAVLVALLCWFGFTKLSTPVAPVPPAPRNAPVAVAPVPVVKPTPPPVAAPVPAPVVTPAQPKPEAAAAATIAAGTNGQLPPGIVNSGPLPFGTKAWDTRSAFIEPGKLYAPPPMMPQIQLSDTLGSDNLYHDDAMGISVTYPAGWSVMGAQRWGENNSENSVRIVADNAGGGASMYYQQYPNGYPELEGTTAYFQRVAQNKENQRISGGVPDYKNVPSSFEYTDINGNPALSYFAVYNRGNETYTEYYIRILGKTKYVMFSSQGKLEDVQKLMPQIKQMAATVKVP